MGGNDQSRLINSLENDKQQAARQLEQLNLSLQSLQRELGVAQGLLQARTEVLNARVSQLETDKTHLRERKEALEREVAELQAARAATEAASNTTTNSIGSVSSSSLPVAGVSNVNGASSPSYNPWASSLTEYNQQEQLVIDLQERLQRVTQQLEEADARVLELEEEKRRNHEMVQRLEATSSQVSAASEASSSPGSVDKAQVIEKELQREITNLRAQLEASRIRQSDLERANQSLRQENDSLFCQLLQARNREAQVLRELQNHRSGLMISDSHLESLHKDFHERSLPSVTVVSSPSSSSVHSSGSERETNSVGTSTDLDIHQANELVSQALVNCVVTMNYRNINLTKFFRELDTNEDDFISVDELARGLIKSGRLNEKIAQDPTFRDYVESFGYRKPGHLAYSEFFSFIADVPELHYGRNIDGSNEMN